MIQTLPRRTLRPDILLFWSVVAFVAIIALAGGSSRAASFGQVIVRIAATLAATGWLVFGRRDSDRRLWLAWAWMGLCAGLIGVQLIPLPPSMWNALPGREAYAAAAAAADTLDSWRPVSLAPDLGWSSLFALIVPAALLVGLSQMSSRARASLLLPVAVLIFASGVLGLAQVTGGPQSALRWYGGNPDPSAIGFLANRNHQALLLACALPVLAALGGLMAPRLGNESAARFPRARRGVLGWIVPAVAAFVVLMLPTTGSRAGLVLGGLAILLSLAISAPALRAHLSGLRRLQRRRVVAATAVVIVGLVAVLVFLGRNVAFSRVASLDPLKDFRVRALPVVMDITRSYFPWGTGFGSFNPVFRHFEPFELLKLTYFNQAHNDILQIVMEGGIAAGLALAVFVIWWIVATIRAWRAPVTAQALAARAGSAIVLLCLAASVVDYPLRTPLIVSLFTLAAIWMLTPAPTRSAAEATQ